VNGYWEKLADLDSKWKMGPKYVESALSAAPPSPKLAPKSPLNPATKSPLDPAPKTSLNSPQTTTVSTKGRRSYSVSTPPSPTSVTTPLKKWELVCEETHEVTTTAPTYSVPPTILFALASFLFAVGLDHEARQVAEIALSEFQQTQDSVGIARALYLLGIISRDLGYFNFIILVIMDIYFQCNHNTVKRYIYTPKNHNFSKMRQVFFF
jgi:hypothetical protein